VDVAHAPAGGGNHADAVATSNATVARGTRYNPRVKLNWSEMQRAEQLANEMVNASSSGGDVS